MGIAEHNYEFCVFQKGQMNTIMNKHRWLYCFVVFAFSCHVYRASAQSTCAPIPPGLVSWWRAEGNALDQVSGNNGSLVGNATYAPGEVGTAFMFSGSASAVQLGNPTDLQLQDFTIEGWIQRASTTVTSQDTPNFGFILSCAWGGYGFGQWNDGRLCLTQVGYSNISSTNKITDLNYHHVAVAKSGTNIYFYIDGVGEVTGPYDPGFVFNGPFAIGARGMDFVSGYYGAIDEISVYSRPLSSSEIQSIYFAGSSGKCISPTLPFILLQPTNQVVTAGGTVSFVASANGTQPLSYQWLFDSTNLPGATSATLTLTDVQLWQAGTYALLITNTAGSTLSSNATLSVLAPTPPVIILQPTNQAVPLGGNVSFVASADGTQPLTYQWLLDSTNLPGATSAILTLNNVQAWQAGTYALLVTNTAGSALSSNATLAVLAPPPCSNPASNLVSWWRAEGNALDQVGGNNGSLVGNAGYSLGEVDMAFTFSGSGSAVQLGNPVDLQLQDFTIEGWIQRASTSITSQNNPNFGFIFSSTWGGYGLGQWDDGRLCLTKVGYSNISSTNTITDLNYHHVAVAKSGTNIYFYIDGVGEVTGPYDPGFVFNGPFAIGARGMDFTVGYYGSIDEMSVYSRPLSSSEIQAIYNAGASGKCVVAVAPFFVSEPVSSIVTEGQNITFSATVAGTPPFTYQWQFQTKNIASATNSSLTLTNVQFNQGGNYSLIVSNAGGSITSSNALLTVSFPPATVELVTVTNAPSNGSVTVPVLLGANGNENGLGFSLSFPSTDLQFTSVTLGSGASGASLVVNTNQVSSGMLGVAIVLPADTTLSAGTQDVVDVTFSTAIVTNATIVPINFGDQPIVRRLADTAGNPLAANYLGGAVTISATALEGDVWPRPNGDEALNISDWVQEGRFVAGLDVPANGSEFQRADCAPRATLGDGQITVIDWVQVGRYVAGLDPLTAAGGPTNQTTSPGPLALQPGAPHKLGGGSRELLVTSGVLFPGQTATASVELVAQGDENALGFSLDYDPTLVSLTAISPGTNPGGATININTNQAASGRVGIAIALPVTSSSVSSSFPAGTQQLLRLSFQTLSTNTETSAVAFGDLPVLRQVSDPTATPLATSYASGTVSINPLPALSISSAGQNISLAWPVWATNFSLQEANGGLPPVAFWSNQLRTPVITNNQNVLTLPLGPGPAFYRLAK
jgi:hypothetical protein